MIIVFFRSFSALISSDVPQPFKVKNFSSPQSGHFVQLLSTILPHASHIFILSEFTVLFLLFFLSRHFFCHILGRFGVLVILRGGSFFLVMRRT